MFTTEGEKKRIYRERGGEGDRKEQKRKEGRTGDMVYTSEPYISCCTN